MGLLPIIFCAITLSHRKHHVACCVDGRGVQMVFDKTVFFGCPRSLELEFEIVKRHCCLFVSVYFIERFAFYVVLILMGYHLLGQLNRRVVLSGIFWLLALSRNGDISQGVTVGDKDEAWWPGSLLLWGHLNRLLIVAVGDDYQFATGGGDAETAVFTAYDRGCRLIDGNNRGESYRLFCQ